MSDDVQARLVALERALVTAATAQIQRHRRRRRRVVVLAAVMAPLALAVAGSMAATGFFAASDRQLSALRDERLLTRPEATAQIAGAAGERPRDRTSGRTWLVAGQRVVGYTTHGGNFCFHFVERAGGCLAKNGLSRDNPVNVMTDNEPGALLLYGLAMDGVTAVSLSARGSTRHAVVGRNAFYLEVRSLGSRQGFVGTLTVRLLDGAVRRLPLRVGGFATSASKRLPGLPGFVPVANTAA